LSLHCGRHFFLLDYANPWKEREALRLLIICEPDIVIFSVKKTSDGKRRSATDGRLESPASRNLRASDIWGERWIKSATHVSEAGSRGMSSLK